jgi:4-amino-4-deoxy-L-arabinose transferase-like glycosyltransferase
MQMITYFTVWHYTVVVITVFIFFLLVFISLREERPGVRNAMIFSSLLVMTLVSGFLILALDKYTKKVKLYGLNNYRQLSQEKILYSGYVKNTGNYTIGTVKIEFKIVNKGHVSGNVKGGSFYNPSGISEFFSGGTSARYRPQKIEETVIVARNLQPGKAKYFNVSFDYPPYFKQVSHFQRIFAH